MTLILEFEGWGQIFMSGVERSLCKAYWLCRPSKKVLSAFDLRDFLRFAGHNYFPEQGFATEVLHILSVRHFPGFA